MSKYTTTLYEVLKNSVPNSNTMTTDQLVEEGVQYFFDFNFPWYTDIGNSRNDFMKMYLTRYLMNEIGQETLGAHKQYFKALMYESMEELTQKYNLLTDMHNIAGERRLKHDEIINDTENTTSTATQDIRSTGVTTQKQDTQSIHSDNPQVTFAKIDYASEMDRGETTANINDSTTSNSNGKTEGNRAGNTLRDLSEIETDTRNSDKYFTAIARGVYLINTELLIKCRRLFMQLW